MQSCRRVHKALAGSGFESKSVEEMDRSNSDPVRRNLLASHIPLLEGTVVRLDSIINALNDVSKISNAPGALSPEIQSEKIMY